MLFGVVFNLASDIFIFAKIIQNFVLLVCSKSSQYLLLLLKAFGLYSFLIRYVVAFAATAPRLAAWHQPRPTFFRKLACAYVPSVLSFLILFFLFLCFQILKDHRSFCGLP